MIPVPISEEPADFDVRVRQPGTRWLAEHAGSKRPYGYWSQCLPHLAAAFGKRCGYAAMYDPTGGTVDHYRSFKNEPQLAYEWSNYRFASSPLNSSKKTADADVLDPYEIQPGWFEIILPSLQLQMTDRVPELFRERAQYTLRRLKLRDGERIIEWRQGWYDAYLRGGLTLDQLREWAPLIADAIERYTAR